MKKVEYNNKQREKKISEIPQSEDDERDFSYEKMGRMRLWRLMSGTFLVGAILYGMYWFTLQIF